MLHSPLRSPLRPVLYDPLVGKWGGGISSFATGVLSFNGNAVDAETVTIGVTVYRFVAVLSAAYDVLIGATASVTILNLIAAVNDSGGEGTNYGNGTSVHPDVTAASEPGKMNVTAKVAGAAGNSIATTSTSVTATWGAATLQGGAGAVSTHFTSFFDQFFDPTISGTVTGSPVSAIRSPVSSFATRPRFQQSNSSFRPAITAGRLVFTATNSHRMDGSAGYTMGTALALGDPAYAEAGKGPTCTGLAFFADGRVAVSHFGKKHQDTAGVETFNGSICIYPSISQLNTTPDEIRLVEELGMTAGGPQGVCIDAQDQSIWFTDLENGRVVNVDPVTKTIVGARNYAIANINGLTYDTINNRLIGWNSNANTLTFITKAGATSTLTGALRDFDNPDQIWFDGSYGAGGALYATNRGNGTPGRMIKYDMVTTPPTPVPVKSWIFDEALAIEGCARYSGNWYLCVDAYYHGQGAINVIQPVTIDDSSPDYGTDLVIAWVGKIAATPAATVALLHGGDSIGRKGVGIFYTTTANQTRVLFRGDSTQATMNFGIASTTTEHLAYLRLDTVAHTATLYINGVIDETITDALITGSIPRLVWTAGASYESTGLATRFAAVTVGGGVITTRTDDQAEIEGRLNWGDPAAPVDKGLLPAGHPYENSPPA